MKNNIHDSLIRKAIYFSSEKTLLLQLRCGDQQNGYFDLDLHYKNVEISPDQINTLKDVAQNPMTEILYDEVDVAEKKIIQRILFWPIIDLEFSFTEFSFVKKSVRDRQLVQDGDKFLEISD